jgi:hypothetical protein
MNTLASCLGLGLLVTGWACPVWAQEVRGGPPVVLFSEGFDDTELLSRGWYDGDRFAISNMDAHAGDGCIEYHWQAGSTTPQESSGLRRLFEPSDSVYLRFSIKLSKDWGWTGRDYHPHLMHFMTTENSRYHGPAASHLTLYVEPHAGRLRLAAQDIQNQAAPHGLTQGPLRGGYNGKFYDSPRELFVDDRWHTVEVLFKLNTLDKERDQPNADGIVCGWFDGERVIHRTDVDETSCRMLLPKFDPEPDPSETVLGRAASAIACT